MKLRERPECTDFVGIVLIVSAFAATGKPIVLVLTETDLYRDIQTDKKAQESLRLANSLVTLQEAGLEVIPKLVRFIKAFQNTRASVPVKQLLIFASLDTYGKRKTL
jgi:GTPase SAR1 family protein